MSILVINHHGMIAKYGSNHRHYKIGKVLSENGYKYTLISSSLRQNNQKYIHNELIKNDVVNENFNFISIKTKPKYNNNILRFINYLDFTYKVSKIEFETPPKHIVGSSVHPFTWIAAYKLSKKYNAEFHVEIRDIWPLSLLEDLKGVQKKVIFNFFNLLEKKYYPLAKSIIVTAPKGSNYLKENFNIPDSKITYIPHSIDVKQFEKNELNYEVDFIKASFNENFNITYVGSLSSSEGLENLIVLAGELKNYKNIKIHIFGEGKIRDKINNLIMDLNLMNVKLYGSVNSKYIPYILRKSDVLWCGLKERQAFKYGISKNKFYEYIAAEKPIIFHSNVEDSPLNNVDNAYLLKINESAKNTVLRIRNGEINTFDSKSFLYENHSDEVIAFKFLETLENKE